MHSRFAIACEARFSTFSTPSPQVSSCPPAFPRPATQAATFASPARWPKPFIGRTFRDSAFPQTILSPSPAAAAIFYQAAYIGPWACQPTVTGPKALRFSLEPLDNPPACHPLRRLEKCHRCAQGHGDFVLLCGIQDSSQRTRSACMGLVAQDASCHCHYHHLLLRDARRTTTQKHQHQHQCTSTQHDPVYTATSLALATELATRMSLGGTIASHAPRPTQPISTTTSHSQ
jgi:hypothetical protein